MSVASRNPFAILNDDDSSPPNTPAPPAQIDRDQSQTKAETRGGHRGKAGPASRTGRYYQRGGATRPPPTGDADEVPIPQPSRRNVGEERGRGRGSGRGRGGDRGDRGARGRGGRAFDRHSQTGKTDSEKQVNQGWGADEGIAELKAEEAGTNDAAAEVTPSNDWANEGAAPPAADGWGAAEAPAEGEKAVKDVALPAADERDSRRFNRDEEEEDNTLTLDQYLAQKKEKETAAVPKLDDVRKANEGADESLWKEATKLDKQEEDVFFAGRSKATPKEKKDKAGKVYLDIEARFTPPARGGRGGRGGDRGGDRGSRGNGRGRGDRGRGGRGRGDAQRPNGGAAVNVDDQSAFPSLS